MGVCRLVNGRITCALDRLCPALASLALELANSRIAVRHSIIALKPRLSPPATLSFLLGANPGRVLLNGKRAFQLGDYPGYGVFRKEIFSEPLADRIAHLIFRS